MRFQCLELRYSNSMIEAVNKIIKYDYIFRKPIPDPEHAVPAAAEAIGDYNERPHYALKGLCPNQSHSGLSFDKEAYRTALIDSRKRRLSENRSSCDPCMAFSLDAEEELA